MQPPFVLYRNQGEPFGEGLREDADARSSDVIAPVHTNPVDPTAWRIFLEHVARQVQGFEVPQPSLRPSPQPISMVGTTRHAGDADRGPGRHQANRLPWHTETGFNLRTHGHPLDMWTENIREEHVALVPSVVSDFIAEQASTDADARAVGNCPHGFPCGHLRLPSKAK